MKQWIELYQKDLKDNLSFELHSIEKGKHLIIVDDQLSNEHFFFLVNYLKYPEGIDYHIDINGYTLLENKENTPIQVFIPDNDTEFDNIQYVTENSTIFKCDFGGTTTNVKSSNKTYTPFPTIQNSNLKTKLSTSKKNKSDKKNIDKAHENFIGGIRISIFLFIILIGCYFVFNQVFNFCFTALSFCFTMWLHFDYKVLQRLNLFFKLLAFSVMILVLPHFLIIDLDKSSRFMIEFSSIMPFTFLITQYPLRLLFKEIMKREPIVKKPAPTFADGTYAIILFILMLASPLAFYTYIIK